MWPLLIGAMLGAAMDKKDPLRGAVLGGATGGVGAEALGAGEAANGGLLGGFTDADAIKSMGGDASGLPAAAPMDGLLKGFKDYAPVAANTLSAASMAKNLTAHPNIQGSAPPQSMPNSNIFAQLAQPYQQEQRRKTAWG